MRKACGPWGRTHRRRGGGTVPERGLRGNVEAIMDVVLIEAREALLQRRNSLWARASGQVAAAGGAAGYRGETLTHKECEELRHIDEALARMEEGQFGRCARCGGAIGRHRLRAIPEARYCMTCSDAVGRCG